jgi:beta-1,4-mannosyltransferase
MALAAAGVRVDLIGHAGTPVLPAIQGDPRIHVRALRPVGLPRRGPRGLYLMLGGLRAVFEAFRLGARLALARPRFDLILVQNPPAIPTLAVAGMAARMRGARFVVDWHNLAYSMLGLRLGPKHWAVRWARRFERFFSRSARSHLCVSKAMRERLSDDLGVRNALVLYDRPQARFVPTPPAARDTLLRRLAEAEPALAALLGESADRPRLAVTSTSFRDDEDLDLLLSAARELEPRLAKTQAKSLVIVVTGRGPLRDRFIENAAALGLERITILSLWLTQEDYPGMLGAADVGICLHRSSSGVDLPMKLADMHGAGLPVLALDYAPCLTERLKPGENGFLFRTAHELADGLGRCVDDTEGAILERLRVGVARVREDTWTAGWRREAAPVLLGEGVW